MELLIGLIKSTLDPTLSFSAGTHFLKNQISHSQERSEMQHIAVEIAAYQKSHNEITRPGCLGSM